MTDLVAAVAAAVDYDAWTTTEDGDVVPQITTDTTIHAMLRLLDIQPGMGRASRARNCDRDSGEDH